MSTFVPSANAINRKWYVVDASGKTLGRLATDAASYLAGKRSPQYTPYIDMGDHIVVINAEKIRLTGLKSQTKIYRRYTGFPGGLREESLRPPPQPQARKDPRRGDQGHAAQDQDGPPDGHQAQGLSRRQAPPPGAAAGGWRCTAALALATAVSLSVSKFEGQRSLGFSTKS